jgi:hypothetical protein
MNSNSQLEVHPDAEILNAFAEQGLATPERTHVLAHLAACGRCRQVVYLAQHAATDAEVPARVAPTIHAKRSQPWFANWRFVWIPAAALAAALALVVTFHPRHAATGPEVAKVAPENEGNSPAHALPEQAKGAVLHPPAVAAGSMPMAKSMKGVGHRATSGVAVGSGGGSSYGRVAEPGSLGLAGSAGDEAQVAAGPPPAPMIATQPDAPQFKPEPAVAAWQQEQQRRVDSLSSAGPVAKAAQPRMRETSDKSQASRTTSVSTTMPWSETAPPPSSSYGAAMQQLSIAEMPGPKAHKSIKLPSGQMAVSTAIVEKRILAVDLAGTLYLSTDIGKHWQTVAQQWTGRAIEVRAPKAFSDPNSQAVAFDLVNDSGLTWVSADGNTWKAK